MGREGASAGFDQSEAQEPAGARRSAPEEPGLPWVATRDATDVAATPAVLNMEYDFKGYQSGQVQFAFRPSGDAEWAYTPWAERPGSGIYSETVGGLAPNTGEETR